MASEKAFEVASEAASEDTILMNEDYEIIKQYWFPRSETFKSLIEIQNLVRENPEADEHFQRLRESTITVTPEQQRYFFRMMMKIGSEMQAKENIIPPPARTINLRALDICMAPGGYSATVFKFNRYAEIRGLSLPPEDGGHEMHLRNWQEDKRVKIEFVDVTMLSSALGYPKLVPADHPHAAKFSNQVPFKNETFDIVFCDGIVLYSHARAQETVCESSRLTSAQLIIAMQRLKPGGTLVMLLHQVYSPATVRILAAFNKFANISLFKPTVSHRNRSSFYLIAKNVEPASGEGQIFLKNHQIKWMRQTAESFDLEVPEDEFEEDEEPMDEIMDTFGDELLQLSEPLWEIQIEAMKKLFFAEK
ncbi:hypothetical protein PDE_00750 [Penicillium oxalicum 114-2]|uniref:Ribosomal RNA methyltransferase FtsJ domain-containing protein n=2 Tax=Penicillium oxalicum TaxID=69781 RepID=S7Z6R1_PENO1|nr:hypothetical protein PDE_00750 [Penicillium oxalicum 114-2]